MNDQPLFDDVFNRPPRVYRKWRTETVELPEPPIPPGRNAQSGWLAIGMPIMSAAVMIGATAAISRGGYGLLIGIPMAMMALMGVMTTLVTNRALTRQAAAELAERQAFFEQQLSEKQQHLHELYEEEKAIRRENHPQLEELQRIAGALGTGMAPQPRLWERRVGDPDFLELAIGIGRVSFSSMIAVPRPQRDSPVDPRLFALAQQYRMLDNVPITVSLREIGSLGIAGPRPEGLGLLRALIWQAAIFHAPAELRIAVVVPREATHDWEIKGVPWAPWLPHTIPLSNAPEFSARMYARDDGAVDQLMSTLLDQLSRRRDMAEQHKGKGEASAPVFTPILVIVDGVERVRDQPALSEIMRDGPRYNMLALFLVKRWEDIPSECGAMLELRSGSSRWMRAGSEWSSESFKADTDTATVQRSNTLARRLAPLKMAESGSNQDVPRSVRLFDLLDIKDESDLSPPVFWNTPLQRAWHPDVPIGQKAGGQPMYLDLYEQMHGPHGIIAGATGAGKSVLLQSLIAALAIKHSPQQLQLLLIDFKGGASLAQLARLPHKVGFVTDLEGRLAERAMTAIKSEIRYRKNLFRAAEAQVGSKIENISEYRAKAPQGLEKLANLLIVIDEFDEMVQSYREFVSELVRVVKQGRSLGVHLLLASQQPTKAVTDDIRTQLKFFIALRLGSSEDSREMLQKSDAAFLPTNVPGRAYFRVGSDVALFQVAQVTSAYQPRDASHTDVDDLIIIDPGEERRPLTSGAIATASDRTTDLDVLVGALESVGDAFFQKVGARPRPIWQPPLPPRLALAEVSPAHVWGLQQTSDHHTQQPSAQGDWLRAMIGRLDIPQESRQEPFGVRLADGHLAILGASGSGKTMLLRTMLLSLALAHTPRDMWCYVIDSGGQGLSVFANLPHVGSVIPARDRERVDRLIGMIDGEILRRQELFRTTGSGDLATYRRERERDLPAWVVVIDNIALLREEFKDKNGFEAITDELIRLARIGRTYGIHFVITAAGVRDITYQLFSLLDTRIALRLPELQDYTEVLGGRTNSQIPATLPGRALWMHPEQGPLELQVALPLLEQLNPSATATDDDQATVLDSELNVELKETIARLRQIWQRTSATANVQPTPIELLPDQVTLQQLDGHGDVPQDTDDETHVPIGKEGVKLGVGYLSFSRATPHNLIVGGKRTGKTTALQTILIGLAQRYDPDQMRFIIVDGHRRGLHGLQSLPHTEAYAVTEAEIQELVQRLEQLHESSSGATACRWVIAIDDYDIGYKNMESQFKSAWDQTNLFSVLKRLAAEGGEYGMHLLLAANIQFPEEAGEVVKTLDAGRNGLILWPHKYDRGTRMMDVELPIGERDSTQPRGRALLVQEDQCLQAQIAVALEADVQRVAASRPAEEVSR